MTGVLAVVALACAAAACAAAIRTQRTVHCLAKALAREWGLRLGGAPSRSSEEERLAEREEWLKRSIEALEQRLREALSRAADLDARPVPAAPAPPAAAGARAAPASPSDRVREHLVALGFEEIAILPARTPGAALLVEARREGMPAKGSARLTPDGRVELRWGAPLRAFP